jgi:hypothetical protein
MLVDTQSGSRPQHKLLACRALGGYRLCQICRMIGQQTAADANV